jgi:hypothetical protein
MDDALEGRVGRRARHTADDDDQLLVWVVGPTCIEQLVGLAGLELAFVGVFVGVHRADPADRHADDQRADGGHEPQDRDGPPMARAPHSDADRCGLAAR